MAPILKFHIFGVLFGIGALGFNAALCEVDSKEQKFIKISAQNVIEETLKYSSAIQSAAFDVEISRAEESASGADFDYLVTLSPGFQKKHQLSIYTYENFDTQTSTLSFSMGVKTKFHLGLTLETTFQSLRQTTDAPTEVFPKYYQGAFQVKLTQPILKGFGRTANFAFENKAKAKAIKYVWALKEKQESEILKALEIFYDLWVITQKIEIVKKTSENTEETHKADLAKLAAGKKGNLDVLGSRARLATVKAKLIVLGAEHWDLSEDLARLILPPRTKTPLIYATESFHFDFKNWKGSMLEPSQFKRASLLRTQAEMEEAHWDAIKAEQDLKPELNLTIQWKSAGLSTGFGGSVNQSINATYPSWEIGLQFKVPLPWNSSGHGSHQQAHHAYLRNELSFQQQKLMNDNELTRLRREIEIRLKTLESTEARIENLEKKSEAKDALYLAGKIGLLEKNEAWDEFSEARSLEISEIAALAKSAQRAEIYRK